MRLSIEDNTVSAKNQVTESQQVSFFPGKGGVKICFIGNSITRHAPSESIGWHGDWGMAASCAEKDYCHLLIKKVREKHPDAAFMILQEANWERNFWKEDAERYDAAMRQIEVFDPDIVVLRLAENVSREDTAEHDFGKGFDDLCRYVSDNSRRKLLITDSFWYSPWTENEIRTAAEKYAGGVISLYDLGNRDDMKALGLFEHAGVAAHPGDEGMAEIAKRIGDRLLPLSDTFFEE